MGVVADSGEVGHYFHAEWLVGRRTTEIGFVCKAKEGLDRRGLVNAIIVRHAANFISSTVHCGRETVGDHSSTDVEVEGLENGLVE